MSAIDGLTLEGLTQLIDKVTQLQTVVNEASDRLKEKKRLLSAAEWEVAQALATMPKDQLPFRSHGRTWRPEVSLHVNVPQGNIDKAIEAAQSVGINAVSVNTSRIKGWLLEQAEERKEAGEALEKIAEDTPFDGIVSEYSEIVLRSRKSS